MKRARMFLALVLVAGFAFVWHWLGPTALGGSMNYLTVYGTSMKPRFTAGDLVIVERQAHYHVGELVAYHNKQLHSIVFHQIVKKTGNRYVFKGLNNHFEDAYHPAKKDLIGAYWASVPHAGLYLRRMMRPLPVSMLMALIAFLWLMDMFPASRKKAKKGRKRMKHQNQRRIGQRSSARNLLTGIAGFLIALMALSLYFWISALRAPLVQKVSTAYPFTERAAFSYQEKVPLNAVYSQGLLTTGQPIFINLVRSFPIRVQYWLTGGSQPVSHLHGTYSLDMAVHDSLGWTRTIPLVSTRPFTGTTIRLASTVSTVFLSHLMTQVDSLTKEPYSTYTMDIVAHVDARGQVGSTPLVTSFNPSLPFSMSNVALQVTPPSPFMTIRQTLSPTHSSMVHATQRYPNQFSVLGLKLSLPDAKLIFGIASGVFLVGTALMLWLRRRLYRLDDENLRIQTRYGSALIPLQGFEKWDDVPKARVMTMEHLVRIAENVDGEILHWGSENSHMYFVETGDRVFYYQVSEQVPDVQPAAPAQADQGGSS